MKKNEKMICVAGVMVPESKVEGRRAALAHGRRIQADMQASLKETRQEEIRQLREAGWKEDEITLLLNAASAEAAVSHGFIKPTRVIREIKRQWGPTMMP